MKRSIIAVAMASGLALSIAGCTSVQEAIGLSGKHAPDEFMVTSRRQPLALPPDHSLRPPKPGAPARQDEEVAQEARRAVFGSAASDPTKRVSSAPGSSRLSAGEAGLLRRAGAVGVDPNIRHLINQETVALAASNKTLVDEILFWRQPARQETLVDANAEADRLRRNAESGKAATEGETPTIKRTRRGLLDGLIN